MKVIRARNVHQALFLGLTDILAEGVPKNSRNGPVLVFPEPVTTVYQYPLERVVYHPERDANPFFHFFESLWMLAGRRGVSFLAQFVPRMKEYSDNGVDFHGAYGYRWRNWFDYDQLWFIIKHLRANKDDRRQVLSMWDARADLGEQEGAKDLPCNLQVIFQVSVHGTLDMTVTNRSNDMLWGAYGANAVHFSYLQEFMAAAIGIKVGKYYQVSNNLHVYTETEVFKKSCELLKRADMLTNLYITEGALQPFPINVGIATENMWNGLLAEIQDFVDNPQGPFMGHSPFIRRVVVPMWMTWCEFRNKKNPDRFKNAYDCSKNIKDFPWRIAVDEWMHRRLEKLEAKR